MYMYVHGAQCQYVSVFVCTMYAQDFLHVLKFYLIVVIYVI